MKKQTEEYINQVEDDFKEALNDENLDWLDGLTDGLTGKYKKISENIDRKEFAMKCLEIFHMKNKQEKTAVILAAEHGKTSFVRKWYRILEELIAEMHVPAKRKSIEQIGVASKKRKSIGALLKLVKARIDVLTRVYRPLSKLVIGEKLV